MSEVKTYKPRVRRVDGDAERFPLESRGALSARKKPSERLQRVARRWDIPPIDERTFDPLQTFEGVRSKIVTTPAGELVLWGNRQTTLILEQARAMIGDREPFKGLVMPRKDVDKVFPIIMRVAHGSDSMGKDGRNLFKLAENLAVLSSRNEGGIVAYVDADDTRTKAGVRRTEMHESVHVAQLRIGREGITIVSAAWMRRDPDYRQIAQSKIGQAYARKPALLAGEAAAYVLSGQWDEAGYSGAGALERARSFAGRYLREVARLHGVEAVKKFRDIHPEMSAVVERVVTHGNKTQRAKSGSRGRTRGGDEGGFATIDRARSIGERERQRLGEWLREGWRGISGEHAPQAPAGVGETEKSGELKFSPDVLTLGRGGSDLRSDPGSPQEVSRASAKSLTGRPDLQSQKLEERASGNVGSRALALASALEQIASIDPSDLRDRRSWRELAKVVVETAREAIAGFDRAEGGNALPTLREIAGMDPRGGMEARHSCKEVTLTAVEMARSALEKISPGANIRTDIAIGFAETAQNAHINGRAPARGISW